MAPKVQPKSSRTRGHSFGDLQDGSFVLSSFWLVLCTAISIDHEELDSFLILLVRVVLISCINFAGGCCSYKLYYLVGLEGEGNFIVGLDEGGVKLVSGGLWALMSIKL